LFRALATQPFGAAVALAGLASAAFAAYCLVRRRSLLEVIGRLAVSTWLFGAVVLLLLSWLYKYATFAPA
jgi:hypothetical protein